MAEREPPARGEESLITAAGTVVPLRDGPGGLEVLLLKRSSRGAFGGMWVFPGGKVEQEDLTGGGGEVLCARRAAVREAREEAGLVFEEAALVPLSFWLPPPEAPRRFATWFFLVLADRAASVEVDLTEIHEHRWASPGDAMSSRDGGRIQLAPPTFTTLWTLSGYDRAAAALEAASSEEPGTFVSHVAIGEDGVVATLWEGDAGYDDRDFARPGPRRRLVMDPRGWRVEISA